MKIGKSLWLSCGDPMYSNRSNLNSLIDNVCSYTNCIIRGKIEFQQSLIYNTITTAIWSRMYNKFEDMELYENW